MTDNEERDRGFLAPVDRAFLRGEKSYEHRQSTYDRRQTIRDRTRDAVMDFEILYEHLSDDQREKILSPRPDPRRFEQFGGGKPTEEQQQAGKKMEEALLDRGFMCAMALLFEQRGEDRFEEILERAITHVLADERRPGGVDPAAEGIIVDVSITHTDTVTPNRMAQKIRQSGVDRLSPSEQRALLHLLQVTGEKAPETPDEFAEIYRSFITDHYEGDPVDMDRAIITLDPFEVTEGSPNPLNDDDVMSELTGEFP